MSKKKILVVDDSRTALFMVTTILRKERYELVTASDGEQALEVAAAELPDLILMDVIMPRKTGFEACRELKRRAETQAGLDRDDEQINQLGHRTVDSVES